MILRNLEVHTESAVPRDFSTALVYATYQVFMIQLSVQLVHFTILKYPEVDTESAVFRDSGHKSEK